MGFIRKFTGAIFCLVLATGSSAGGFSFAALGDTPYSGDEEARFPDLIAAINREKLAFVVHVGDFKSAITACTDELYRQRKEWFELSHHPWVFLPGDNEWTDCRRTLGEHHAP